MYHEIVVGCDGKREGRDAVELARLLADATPASVTVAYVHAREPALSGKWLGNGRLEQRGERALGQAIARLDGRPGVSTQTIVSRSAAHGLHELAEDQDADLIVVGSTHRGLVGRVLAGTTAERLLEGSGCAVAVAPVAFAEDAPPNLRVIEAAFDGSAEATFALHYAAALAETAGAALRVVAVAEPLNGYTGLAATATGGTSRDPHEYLRARLDGALDSLPRELRPHGTLLSGDPATVLAIKAEEGVDLLVTGSRGYGPLRSVLLGGVSSKLMRIAPCPVLVVPRSLAAAARVESVGKVAHG